MKYDVEMALSIYGYDNAKKLIMGGCTQVELHKALNLSQSNSRLNANVYQNINSILGITEVPYKKDPPLMRKFKLEQDRVNGRYWESEYIVEHLLEKLNRPIVNMSGKVKRLVISCPRHPKADPVSNQIKAHIIVWEICNEMFIPEGYWVVPVDGDYTNLDVANLELRTIISVQSANSSGTNNPMYQHGFALRHKKGGWGTISKNLLNNNSSCTMCKEYKSSSMSVHHIINYHLFLNPVEAHNTINLMVLCQSCHTKIHQNNTNIKALIEVTQYSKLLELLETLKSQVPDTLIEIYRDVEKQLGLTDNQQLSTLNKGESSTTIPQGSRG
jgi:HNH endonuclease